MKALSILSIFVIWAASAMPAAAQDATRRTRALEGDAPAGELWFHHVQTPLRVSIVDGQALCRVAYDALRGEKSTAPNLGSMAGTDSPRAFFLSWSDGQRPAQTVYGLGHNVPAAFRRTLAKALSQRRPGEAVEWVKLDIIQRGEATGGFVARESRLPLPGLIGLTFGPKSGFVFLPEQLMAWDLVDPRQRLAVHYIAKRLMEDNEWDKAGKWLAVSSYQGGHRICLIEPQSFFCSDGQAVPIFRGHMLYDSPTRDDVLEAARGAADKLVEMCASDGTFSSTLPEWELGKEDTFRPGDQALAVLALCRMARTTDDSRYTRAAARTAAALTGFIRPYGGTPRAGCIPEQEHLTDAAGVVSAKQVTTLTTNALAAVALCEVMELTGDKAYERPLAMLARHLIAQGQPDGSLLALRDFPSLRLRPRTDPESTSAALLAFAKLYGSTARPLFLEKAQQTLDYLRNQVLEPRSMEALPRDPWLAEALDICFTFTRDKGLADQAQRLGLAALLEQTRETAFPDLYGSVGDQLSATLAAERTRILATVARLIDDVGQTSAAQNLIAETRPYTVFQLQGRIRPPSAMYLSEPQLYLDLFRDHVRDYGFELRGQAKQILSLLALNEAMGTLNLETFPEDLAVGRTLPAARGLLTTFPRYLSEQLASTASGPAGRHAVQFRNPSTETFTIIKDGEGKNEESGKPVLRAVPVQRTDR